MHPTATMVPRIGPMMNGHTTLSGPDKMAGHRERNGFKPPPSMPLTSAQHKQTRGVTAQKRLAADAADADPQASHASRPALQPSLTP